MRSVFFFAVALSAVLATICGLADSALAQQAPQKELIAVLDLDIEGGSKVEASGLSDRLREALLKSGRFTLVDRNNMDAALKEIALQQSGCTSQECAVQVGRMLGARKIIVGKVTKFSAELWQVACQMIDVESAETLRAESVIHEGGFVPLLREGIVVLSGKLAGEPTAAAPPPTTAVPLGTLQLTGLSNEHEIEVDGRRATPDPDGRLHLAPGPHRVLARRKGFLPRIASVTITDNETTTLNVGLVPEVAPPEPPASAQNAGEEPEIESNGSIAGAPLLNEGNLLVNVESPHPLAQGDSRGYLSYGTSAIKFDYDQADSHKIESTSVVAGFDHGVASGQFSLGVIRATSTEDTVGISGEFSQIFQVLAARYIYIQPRSFTVAGEFDLVSAERRVSGDFSGNAHHSFSELVVATSAFVTENLFLRALHNPQVTSKSKYGGDFTGSESTIGHGAFTRIGVGLDFSKLSLGLDYYRVAENKDAFDPAERSHRQ